MRKFKYWTADRETGTFIDCFDTIEEAKMAIKEYEAEDKANGDYSYDFYKVVDEDHCVVK